VGILVSFLGRAAGYKRCYSIDRESLYSPAVFPEVLGMEYFQIIYNIILTLYSLRAGFFS
jgi:hypothetical protein